MISSTGTLVTGAGALLVVLVLVAAAARLMRIGGWASRPQAGKLVSLRESVALDTRRRLHLVQCGDKQVLLLTGGPQDVVIGWVGP